MNRDPIEKFNAALRSLERHGFSTMTYGNTICRKRYHEQRDPSCALCAAPPTLELVERCQNCGMNLCQACDNGSHVMTPRKRFFEPYQSAYRMDPHAKPPSREEATNFGEYCD